MSAYYTTDLHKLCNYTSRTTNYVRTFLINYQSINQFIYVVGGVAPIIQGSCMKRMTIKIANNNTIHFNKNSFKKS